MTHNELIARGIRWLFNSQGCKVVVKEIAGVGEEPDLIGFTLKHSIVIECKTSKSDFYADQHKWFRKFPSRGMGLKRYYLFPEGLNIENVNNGWGVLQIRGRIIKVMKESITHKRDYKCEQHLILSALRRLGKAGDDTIAIKVYEHLNSDTRTELHFIPEGQ